MQAILLSTALALAACLTCQADVVIYKNKITFTVTGDGNVNRGTMGGWTLYDPGTGQVIHIYANTRSKTFFEKTEDYQFITVSGRGQELLVMAMGDSFTDDFNNQYVRSLTAKGVKTSLDIGSGQVWQLPKVFTINGSYIFPSPFDNMALEEDKGKLVFDRTQTFQSNGSGETIRQAADRLRESLLNQGYLETT